MSSKNKVAVISGVTSGIGRALALKLATEGYDLALISRRNNLMQTLEKELLQLNLNNNYFLKSGSIADEETMDNFWREFDNRFDTCNLVINNAAIISQKRLNEFHFSDLKELININVFGNFSFIEHGFQRLLKLGPGDLINISSTVTKRPYPAAPVYAATKAAVHHLISSLQEETINNKNIRISNLLLGPVNTPERPDFEILNTTNLASPKDISDIILNIIQSPLNLSVTEVTIRQNGNYHKV